MIYWDNSESHCVFAFDHDPYLWHRLRFECFNVSLHRAALHPRARNTTELDTFFHTHSVHGHLRLASTFSITSADAHTPYQESWEKCAGVASTAQVPSLH